MQQKPETTTVAAICVSQTHSISKTGVLLSNQQLVGQSIS